MAVLILLGAPKQQINWANAQKRMNNPAKFKEMLNLYDKEKVSDAYIKKLQPFLESEYSERAKVKKSSAAAACIIDWINCVVEIHRYKSEISQQDLAHMVNDDETISPKLKGLELQ